MSSPSISEIKQAVQRHLGNKAAAARELGMPRETLRDTLSRESSNASQGVVVGRSTLIDRRTDTTVLEWVKTEERSNARANLEEAYKAFAEKLPKYKPTKAPSHTKADLMSVYPLTDYHLGMLAWGEETGDEDWDLRIAEQMLVDWFAEAISLAPDSELGVLANMSDFLHWDGMDAVTPQHKNLLDADTRFPKLVRVAIRVMRQVVTMLLKKHNRLKVFFLPANHDPASSIWMREWFAVMYENDPRVDVARSPNPYHAIEWGNTMTCFHHGHKRGVKDVDRVFAGMFSEMFGRTKYRYGHVGHLHCDEALETPLMKIERHRTLAPRDAYAAHGGYISGRDSKVITYSKRFGEVSRITINPEMVRHG